MRLTLRTILAYLDDVLQPAQAREIGEKISENKEATALVSQIREVLRRRRVGAPELAGPGSGPDPNVVADYLENSLPANQVVELERLCQRSDMHLAEIAACHKILTMVVGHPVDVSQEIRDRMHLLGAHARPGQSSTPDPLAFSLAEGMEETGPQRKLDALPEYLTRGTGKGRWAVVGTMALVGLGWLALVLTDTGLWTLQPPAGVLTDAQQGQPLPPLVEQVPVEMNIAAIGPLNAQLPAPPGPIMEPSAAVTPPVQIPAAMPPASNPPAANPPASTPPANPPQNPPVPVEPPAPALVELEMNSRTGDGIVLFRLPFETDWQLLNLTIPVKMGQEIVVPQPFHQEFSLGEACTVTLQPGTRVTRTAREEAAQGAITLVRGRMVLASSLTATSPVVVQVNLPGKRWFISLDEPGTRVGVEYSPPSIIESTQPVTPPATLGGIAVSHGQARVWLDGTNALQLTPAIGFASWNADLTQLVSVAPLSIPGWVTPEGITQTAAARQQAKLYEKEFLRDRTVSQSIAPVVKDRRGAIAELAVRTVGLTSDIVDLLPGLGSEQPEARLAAIDELRIWLAQDPAQSSQLVTELSKLFRPEQVQVMLRLLVGIRPADARDPQMSQFLLELLANDEVAIRELTILNLHRLTGKSFEYLASAPSHERRSAINRWEELVRKNGGGILPNPTP